MIFQDISIGNARNGRGLFANKNIQKGDKVLTFEGNIITDAKAKALGHKNHVVPVGLDQYMDVSEPESLINHSCDANTGFSSDTTLVALRDIRKGEELTFDYSLVTIDDWGMDCNCGSKNCRRNVSNFKDLTQKLKEKYRQFTPRWVLKIADHE